MNLSNSFYLIFSSTSIPIAQLPRGFRLANGINGLFPCSGNENYGAALITEGLPHFISQILLVPVREQIRAVDEKKEGRRRWLDLRRIEKLQSMPGGADRLAS